MADEEKDKEPQAEEATAAEKPATPAPEATGTEAAEVSESVETPAAAATEAAAAVATDAPAEESRTGPSPKFVTTASIPTRDRIATPFQRPSPWWAIS